MIEFIDLGLIEYQSALEQQELAVEEVAAGGSERIFLCSHPEVVTLGRKSDESDLAGWTGPTVAVSRGGRATYHGPSQLVIYPILDLRQRSRDIHAYIRNLEATFVECLTLYGITAEGKSLQENVSGEKEDATGVWVGPQKLVSIGIAVRKWITYHGAAINLDDDSQAFRGLNPCGFTTSTMTNLEHLTGQPIDRNEFIDRWKRKSNSSLLV